MTKSIKKDDRTITVQEYSQKWKVSTPLGNASYDVPKRDYLTFEELKTYILRQKQF